MPKKIESNLPTNNNPFNNFISCFPIITTIDSNQGGAYYTFSPQIKEEPLPNTQKEVNETKIKKLSTSLNWDLLQQGRGKEDWMTALRWWLDDCSAAMRRGTMRDDFSAVTRKGKRRSEGAAVAGLNGGGATTTLAEVEKVKNPSKCFLVSIFVICLSVLNSQASHEYRLVFF